jgi:hypothetical protein
VRGEILNEFLEFAAEEGASVAVSDGAYEPSAGYDTVDLVRLVDRLSAAVGEPRAALLERFGAHLFRYFAALYPTFVDDAGSALALLAPIRHHIHGELRKLYPGAGFPTLECTPLPPDRVEIVYRSARPLADLAAGLIRGCIEHFGDRLVVRREDLSGPPGTAARFVIAPDAGNS